MFTIITIPFDSGTETFDETLLTHTLNTKKIISREVRFFQAPSGVAYWTIFVEYDSMLSPSPQCELSELSATEKVLFASFREWRKERAEKEGIPVFIIATNAELKEIITKCPQSSEALKEVKGFGRKKIEKYGEDIIAMVRSFQEAK